MKFHITFKDPEAQCRAIDAAIESFNPATDFTHEELVEYDNLDDEDAKSEFIYDTVKERMSFIHNFLKYGEYITIEFDSETKTAKVLPT